MATSIDKVGVIGAGQMGTGIAQVCAQAGLDVVLNDISEERVHAALATINGSLSRQSPRASSTKPSARRRSTASASPPITTISPIATS